MSKIGERNTSLLRRTRWINVSRWAASYRRWSVRKERRIAVKKQPRKDARSKSRTSTMRIKTMGSWTGNRVLLQSVIQNCMPTFFSHVQKSLSIRGQSYEVVQLRRKAYQGHLFCWFCLASSWRFSNLAARSPQRNDALGDHTEVIRCMVLQGWNDQLYLCAAVTQLHKLWLYTIRSAFVYVRCLPVSHIYLSFSALCILRINGYEYPEAFSQYFVWSVRL